MIEEKDLKGVQDFFEIYEGDKDDEDSLVISICFIPTGVSISIDSVLYVGQPLCDLQGDKFMCGEGKTLADAMNELNRLAAESVAIWKQENKAHD